MPRPAGLQFFAGFPVVIFGPAGKKIDPRRYANFAILTFGESMENLEVSTNQEN